MELAKGVELKYEGGKAILTADVASLAIPMLEDIKKKVESGEIDPVKGTDLDKLAIEQVIALLAKYIQG